MSRNNEAKEKPSTTEIALCHFLVISRTERNKLITINAIHHNRIVVISGVAGRPANRFGHTMNGNQNIIPLIKNDKLQVPHIGLMSATRDGRYVLSLFNSYGSLFPNDFLFDRREYCLELIQTCRFQI